MSLIQPGVFFARLGQNLQIGVGVLSDPSGDREIKETRKSFDEPVVVGVGATIKSEELRREA
jgi:hypothetical protein